MLFRSQRLAMDIVIASLSLTDVSPDVVDENERGYFSSSRFPFMAKMHHEVSLPFH